MMGGQPIVISGKKLVYLRELLERESRRLLILVCWLSSIASGQEKPTFDEVGFKEHVAPAIKKFCVRCHNPDNMESGIRVDQLSAVPEDRQLFLLRGIQKQIDEEAMPPKDEPQLTADQRRLISQWITRTINAARSKETQRNGAVRRLTVAQYRNTLRDLLGLQEDLTDSLPPDGLSKDGFANNAQLLQLAPLQVETYFDIADKVIDGRYGYYRPAGGFYLWLDVGDGAEIGRAHV